MLRRQSREAASSHSGTARLMDPFIPLTDPGPAVQRERKKKSYTWPTSPSQMIADDIKSQILLVLPNQPKKGSQSPWVMIILRSIVVWNTSKYKMLSLEKLLSWLMLMYLMEQQAALHPTSTCLLCFPQHCDASIH